MSIVIAVGIFGIILGRFEEPVLVVAKCEDIRM